MEMFDVEDFRQHAEMCLKEACSIDELTVDEDGDWPIMIRDVPFYVRVVEEGALFVHVFARIAYGVSPEAWAQINHLNKVMTWSKLVWMPNGDVVAGLMLWPMAIDAAILDHALEPIASYALDCGLMLQTVFGSTATAHSGPRHSPGVIPTMAGIHTFGEAAKRFLRFAEAHAELDFYLIGPGCGRAGFDDSVGAWMFEGSPSNVIKPEGW